MEIDQAKRQLIRKNHGNQQNVGELQENVTKNRNYNSTIKPMTRIDLRGVEMQELIN